MSRLAFTILTLSLALNAAFAVVFGLGHHAPATPASACTVASAKLVPPASTTEVGASLRTDDLRALIGRLRAAGYPPEIVRALVAGRISDSFAARLKALQPKDGQTVFWKDAPANPTKEIALARLHSEQKRILDDLLGDKPGTLPSPTQQNRRFDFLSATEADELRTFLREDQEKFEALYRTGNMTGAQREAHRRAHREGLVRRLTPEKLFEYDLRHSTTAYQLRDELATLVPTEEEYRTIFRLRQAHDERYQSLDGQPPNPEQLRAQAEAEQQLTAQIMAALPPERAAAYLRTTHQDYRITTQFVARLQLPPETADALWAVRQEFEDQLRTVLAAPADQRASLLARAREASNARVSTLLAGPGRLDTYKRYGGNWLQWSSPPSRPSS